MLIVFGWAALAHAQDDLIIESGKEGQHPERYQEIEGTKWMDSRIPPQSAKSSAPGLTEPAKCSTRKCIFQGSPQSAAARFYPQFHSRGHYYVYATWSVGANANPVFYIIKHANGEDRKQLVQDGRGALTGSSNANCWILIGDYEFNPGQDQYVELRIDTQCKPTAEKSTAQVYADALRFSLRPLENALDPAAASFPSAPKAPASAIVTGLPVLPAPSIPNDEPPTWYHDITAAQSAAAQTNKKILIFFYGSTPGTIASYLEKEVFEHSEVKPILRRDYVLVRINIDEQPALASKLKGAKKGYVNLYDNRGSAIGQITEQKTCEQFAALLRSKSAEEFDKLLRSQ